MTQRWVDLVWRRAPAVLAVLALGGGCASARLAITPEEYARLARGTGPMAIVMHDPARPDPASVLKQRAAPVSPVDTDLTLLIRRMHDTLVRAKGVGLAAPQIGIARRVILVVHGVRPAGQPTRMEVYLNPRLEQVSPEQDDDYEGCLSVANAGGLVARARRVTMSHDPLGGGPRQTITVSDWDARIVQHEIDHLDGVLYSEKLKGPLLPYDEARRLRDEGHRRRGWLPSAAPASGPASVPAR